LFVHFVLSNALVATIIPFGHE